MRGPSQTVVKRQRHNFINGRITRRPRNPPRLHRSRSRSLSAPVSVHKPSFETSLQRESISDIYVEDHPISSHYNTSSTPSFLPPNEFWQTYPWAVARLRRQRRPPPPHYNTNALTTLLALRELLRSSGRSLFAVIQWRGQSTVYERDFRLVLNEHYFCDNLIDYYLNLIVRRCLEVNPEREVVAISAVETRRVIRAQNRAQGLLPPIEANAQVMIFPVRYVDDVKCPWSLVIADMVNFKITHYNPVQQRGAEYINAIRDALENFYPPSANAWTLDEVDISARCPEDDKPLSGLFVCNFADCFFEGVIPTIRFNRIYFFLMHFLYDICQNRVPFQADKDPFAHGIGVSLERYLSSVPSPLRYSVAYKDGVNLYNTELCTLKGNCYLSPKVIDLYFILIKDRGMLRQALDGGSPRVHIIPSSCSPLFKNYDVDEMESVFRRASENGTIYFPVSIGCSQWALLVIDRLHRTISYYYPRWNLSAENNPPSYVRTMPTFYRLFAGFKLNVVRNIPAVVNRYDSGIYICRYARELIEAIPLDERTFTDLSLPRLRETMRRELRMKELEDRLTYRD